MLPLKATLAFSPNRLTLQQDVYDGKGLLCTGPGLLILPAPSAEEKHHTKDDGSPPCSVRAQVTEG